MKIDSIGLTSKSFYVAYPKINSDNQETHQNKFRLYESKSDTVSFGMRVDYGIPATLAQPLQNKIINIHKNIDLIQNFFARYTTKNPQLGALIKKGYNDLIPKRQSGIVFKLPDSENTIEVMRSQTRDNILYISIDNGSNEYNGIVIDGKDKLVANYLKRHPHMLPSSIKHMNAERIEQAQPEKFIDIADTKLQNYGDYLKQIDSGEIPMPKVGMTPARKAWLEKDKENKNAQKPKTVRKKTPRPLPPQKNTVVISQPEAEAQIKSSKQTDVSEETKVTKFIDRKSEPKKKSTHKPSKLTNEEFCEYMADKVKKTVKEITQLFNMDAKDFPPHLTPKLTPNNKVLGFTLQTDDGGTLKVMKKVVGSYGNSMPYLSFEKTSPDNSMNFISIDMITNKVLRTKDKGKPHISSEHIVYELTPDELKKRKIDEKLDSYMSQIRGKTPEKTEEIIPIQNEQAADLIEPAKENDLLPELPKDNDLEKIKDQMRELGKKNGAIAATEYFNAFKTQFISDLQSKMSEFNENFQKFVESLSK